MYPWQKECLGSPGVLHQSRNLVYTAPTSGGKTLVSELLLLRALHQQPWKQAIFVLPYISLAKEKFRELKPVLQKMRKRVGGFFGNEQPRGGFFEAIPRIDLAVCTIEKANTLVNRLITSQSLHKISMIVVDEVHMCADPSRGYILELMLSKIAYLTQRDPENATGVPSNRTTPQLVCMSATLPQLPTLCTWLNNAALFSTSFRPIPLKRYVLVQNSLSDLTPEVTGGSDYTPLPSIIPGSTSTDRMLKLILPVIAESKSVLVFCHSRRGCSTTASKCVKAIRSLVASVGVSNFPPSLGLDPETVPRRIHRERGFLIARLEADGGAQVDKTLLDVIQLGFAFHHAGLTTTERSLIETGFRDGALHTLMATSTLAVGVNLPARRVILDSPKIGISYLDSAKYHQMCGRAGRAGQDTLGEAIMCIRKNDPGQMKWCSTVLAGTSVAGLSSSLAANVGLDRMLLEAISAELTRSRTEVATFLACTLAAHLGPVPPPDLDESFRASMEASLTKLAAVDYISIAPNGDIAPTHKGNACVAAALTPENGLFIFDELSKAKTSLCVSSSLHLIYLATPLDQTLLSVATSKGGKNKWRVFAKCLPDESAPENTILESIGISRSFVMRHAAGIPSSSASKANEMPKYDRFFTALILHDLVNEAPIAQLEHVYGIDRGTIQGLQAMAASYVGMLQTFCEKLGWIYMETLFRTLEPSLEFGTSPKLKKLMRIPSMRKRYALAFHAVKWTTPHDIACQSVESLFRVVNANTAYGSKFQTKRHLAVIQSDLKDIVSDAYDAVCNNALFHNAPIPSLEELRASAPPLQNLSRAQKATRPTKARSASKAPRVFHTHAIAGASTNTTTTTTTTSTTSTTGGYR